MHPAGDPAHPGRHRRSPVRGRRARRGGGTGSGLEGGTGLPGNPSCRAKQELRLDVGDPRSVSDAGAQEALGRELLEDRDHRVLCDAEFRRGSPGRREPHARFEAAIEDRRTQTLVYLMVERNPGPPIGTDAEREEMEISHVGAHRFGKSRQRAGTPLHDALPSSAQLHRHPTVVPLKNRNMGTTTGNGSMKFPLLDLSSILFCFDSLTLATFS